VRPFGKLTCAWATLARRTGRAGAGAGVVIRTVGRERHRGSGREVTAGPAREFSESLGTGELTGFEDV
jgi:hypothetical protein